MSNKVEDKPLYKILNSIEKVEYVMDQQTKGLNRKDIYILMGYADIKNLDDFMKRRGYVKENNLFVLAGGVKEESEGIQEQTVPESDTKDQGLVHRSQGGDTGHIATLQDVNVQEKLMNMINHMEEYEEMLQWYKAQVSQKGGSQHIIEVVTGLEINYPKTMNIKTSIRLDAKIWERFKKVADTKFSHIDNPSLLSQALYEFLEKYE